MRYVLIVLTLFHFMKLCAVDFCSGMKQNRRFKSSILQEKRHWRWRLVKDLFEKNIRSVTANQCPKIMHHIWLGSKLPHVAEQFRYSWMDHHPNWQFVLWTDNEQNFKFGIVVTHLQELQEKLSSGYSQIVFDVRNMRWRNQKAFELSSNLGQKSDIMRYEVLYMLGGLYVDTDFECLKPFDELHKKYSFYAGIGYSGNCCLLNGLIAAIPKHAVLSFCVHELQVNGQSIADIINTTGPKFFTRCFFKAVSHGCDDTIIALPTTYFYPWPSYARNETDRTLIEKWFCPESFAVHHWHCSWM